MQGSLHRIGGQGNHTTKFNLQWQTSSFKSMAVLSLLEARAEQQLTHTDQAPKLQQGEAGCLQSKQGCRQCSVQHPECPQALCTTRVQYNALTNSTVQTKAGQIPPSLMVPTDPPGHTPLTPREDPNKKWNKTPTKLSNQSFILPAANWKQPLLLISALAAHSLLLTLTKHHRSAALSLRLPDCEVIVLLHSYV